jgi:HD-like signal output (HDOD) protein
MSDHTSNLQLRAAAHALQSSAFSTPAPLPEGLRRPRIVLDDVLAEAIDLRPLPEVGRRLLALAEGDDFSLQDLAIVVGADQALSAKILRIANSPFHRHSRQIGTIRDAVVLLGFRTVRSAALTACLMQTTPPQTNVLDYPDFWRFSVSVGVIAELLAENEEVRDMAFTAGVMHNLGRLALDQFVPREFERAVRMSQDLGMPLRDAQREVLGFTESELGAALATQWSYPDSLVAAIAAGDVDDEAAVQSGPLAQLVTRARRAASHILIADGLPGALAGATPLAIAPASGTPASESVLCITSIGGADELRTRVDAFLEGVFPDRQIFSR